ncbi:MAG: gliding motility lipoprotein GldH [Crocinitomicaceae bacterium]
MKPIIYLFAISLILLSCSDNSLYTKSYEIEGREWHVDQKLDFEFTIEDNSKNNIISLTLRLNEDYPYSNMYIFLETIGANQQSRKDTLKLLLAESDGKWKGEKKGSLVEFVIPIFNGQFPDKGTYHLTMQHGMRDEYLPGVLDVGVKVD